MTVWGARLVTFQCWGAGCCVALKQLTLGSGNNGVRASLRGRIPCEGWWLPFLRQEGR